MIISSIIKFSVFRRHIIILLASTLSLFGLFQISQTGLDIFPEFAPKQVIIQTEAPGYSAEQVEKSITRPLENSLGGLVGVKQTHSESIQGLSVIKIIFADSNDVFRIRQLVSERLSSTTTLLPPGTGPATLVPLSSSSATILTAGLTADQHDLIELRTLAENTLTPRLLSVPGVADVNIFGGEQEQFQIQLDPEKLATRDIGINEVTRNLQQFSVNAGLGFIENTNQRLTLQLNTTTLPPEQLAQIPLVTQRTDQPSYYLTLGDIASVKRGAAPAISAAAVNGKPGVVMMVINQYQANTLEVSKAVEKVLHDFEDLFAREGIQLYPTLFRPADYIETSVSNLGSHLLIGGLFVLIILFLFLFNLRTAIISALAIPLSLISAILVLLALDVNLNIMVLGGLAIALGEVVDDAIIDTENIYRRLREHHHSGIQQTIASVIINASIEVRSSVVYASFIVALVFTPLLTLQGVAGRLFAPLGFAYILAILMSLLVAVTVTPALCYFLLPATISKQQLDPPLIRLLKPIYHRLLIRMAKIPPLLLLTCIVISTITAFILTAPGGQFLPELREGHYIIHTTSLPGTSLQESIRLGNRLTERIRRIEGVVSMSQWAGRAERGADTYGSHYSEYEVHLERSDGKTQQRILNDIREALAEFPGILYEANTFLTERVDETISGYTSPIVVNIYGDDLDALDAKARETAAIMQNIAGAQSIQIRSGSETPQMDIRLRYDQLALWGLEPIDIQTTIKTAYEGSIIGVSNNLQHPVDIVVSLAAAQRNDPSFLATLPVKTPGGTIISLREVADISQSEGRYNILHQNGQRLQTITAKVKERDLSSFMDELREQIMLHIDFGSTMFPEFTGAAVEQAKAKQQLIIHSILAGTGVMLLIFMALGSYRNTWLTLANIPFSLAGGLVAVIANHAELSIGSMVGFVTLFGITVRNSIMLVAHYSHLIFEEKAPWNMETMIRGAQERLPSILMTALVTALAMLPIAIDSDNPGREIMGPMASIIIGGLISSTLLNLVLLPLLLLKYGQFHTLEKA